MGEKHLFRSNKRTSLLENGCVATTRRQCRWMFKETVTEIVFHVSFIWLWSQGSGGKSLFHLSTPTVGAFSRVTPPPTQLPSATNSSYSPTVLLNVEAREQTHIHTLVGLSGSKVFPQQVIPHRRRKGMVQTGNRRSWRYKNPPPQTKNPGVNRCLIQRGVCEP